MEIKTISSKIAFSKIEQLSVHDFLDYAAKYDLYSNIRFLDYFKNKGFWFWICVIYYTNLQIDELYEKFSDYLNNSELFEETIKRMTDYWEKEEKRQSGDKRAKQVVKNIKSYAYEYIRHNTKNYF